jgi:hypothetical protein
MSIAINRTSPWVLFEGRTVLDDGLEGGVCEQVVTKSKISNNPGVARKESP